MSSKISVARSWLLIGLAVGACSSPSDDPKVVATKPASTPPSDAAPTASTPPPDDRYDPGALGAITFANSQGTPKAKALFTRGMLALHSFWYDEALTQFHAAIDADPTMNMAYWGAAMSHSKLLWGDDDLSAAKKLLGRMPNADILTPREQSWVLATIELIRAGDVRTSRKRFVAAMEALHATFPDDESATFLAIGLLASTRPEDPDTLAVRERSAALARGVFERNPKHPGAAHYLIHAYDTPELAARALPFARTYASIAPAAFHARHMPAHIFSRLGMWKEAIASCQSAWDASVASARRAKLSANHHDFHSLNWLVEMNFELGLRKEADRFLTDFGVAVRGGLSRQHRALYANQVASYMMRTAEWSRVDELLAPLESPAMEDADPAAPTSSRVGEPATHCAPIPASSPTELIERLAVLDARARAASMQRDLVKTKRYIGDIDAVRVQLQPFFSTTQPKEAITRMDEAHALRRKGLLARAAGDDRALLAILRQSKLDESEVGGESNPSGFLMHEDIANTLVRLKQHKEAAVEFALAIKTHPGRASSLLGAARAAAKTGDLKAARQWYEQLLQLWSAADQGTDGLAEARTATTN